MTHLQVLVLWRQAIQVGEEGGERDGGRRNLRVESLGLQGPNVNVHWLDVGLVAGWVQLGGINIYAIGTSSHWQLGPS